jgi:Spy/CpxP family protein refolding chaperone
MARTTLQIVAIVFFVALVGTVGMTVKAVNDSGSPGSAGGFSHHMHGGGHHPDPMAALIEELELNPDQQQQLDKIHEILRGYHGGEHNPMSRLHNELVSQFERGSLDALQIRQVVDEQVEQMREMAYLATDELVALVNGLDNRQREILLQHFEEAKDHRGGH